MHRYPVDVLGKFWKVKKVYGRIILSTVGHKPGSCVYLRSVDEFVLMVYVCGPMTTTIETALLAAVAIEIV